MRLFEKEALEGPTKIFTCKPTKEVDMEIIKMFNACTSKLSNKPIVLLQRRARKVSILERSKQNGNKTTSNLQKSRSR